MNCEAEAGAEEDDNEGDDAGGDLILVNPSICEILGVGFVICRGLRSGSE